MVNTKIIVSLIALLVIVALVAGITFSQFASAQANAARGVAGQMPQGDYNGYYQVPQQSYYPDGGAQNGNLYGYGNGMGLGMCGRFG